MSLVVTPALALHEDIINRIIGSGNDRLGWQMNTAKRLIAGLALGLLAALPAESESIQLEELHGVYMVPVRINDAVTIPFVLDSGAGDISVPEDVFKTLMRTRTVTESDLLTPGTYVLADGSEHLQQRFVLHELRVGRHVVKNVTASVAPDKADPLLGQSFLSKLPAWTLDNTQHALVLHDEARPTRVEAALDIQAGVVMVSYLVFPAGVPARGVNDVATLLKLYGEEDGHCRGTFDVGTLAACDLRNRYGEKLEALGWCYGKAGQAGYQMSWHKCDPNSCGRVPC